MSYTPAIPLTGYAGWAFLKRTLATQQSAFAASSEVKTDEAYFRENIGKISTAEELVSDRRLLKVALGAYGLSDDIDNKFFIKKVLQDGTLNSAALANKLSDKQYLKLSAAFGFGDFSVPSTKISTFPDKIIEAYKAREFETAVGNQDGDLRLVLNLQRELPALAAKSSSETTKWLTVLGNTALRTVFETALGLPKSIGTLDLDQQLSAFQDKAAAQLGSNSISQFSDPAALDKLTKRYLLRAEVANMSASTSNNSALQLMQQIVSNGWARRG
jgi:hypothetical protein